MDILFKRELYRSGDDIIYVEQYQPKDCLIKYWRYGFYPKASGFVKIGIRNRLLNKPKKKTLCNILGKDIVQID